MDEFQNPVATKERKGEGHHHPCNAQIGLCFGTPLGVSWFDTLFPTPEGRNPFNAIGYTIIEAISAIVIFLVFIGVLIFYPRTRRGTVGAAPHQGDGHP